MEDKEYYTEIDAQNKLTYLGESLFARNEQGNLKRHIATIFPQSRYIVTEPSTLHGDQCAEYINYLNSNRIKNNAPLLTEEQKEGILKSAVAISIIEGEAGRVYAIIRPDPDKIHLDMAFQADEILQQLLPKFRIFFMHTEDKRIRKAIRKRGESWRIQPLPRTTEGMQKTVANNKITIKLSQRRIYYYNMQTGARFLSYETFEKLGELDCETLRAYLIEIQTYSPQKNREGYSEILFYRAGKGFTAANFQRFDFSSMDEASLRMAHKQLCEEFSNALDAPMFKKDNLDSWDWLVSMVSTISNVDKFATEEYQMGLCEEFQMRINWLPGGQINEDGGIIKDPVYTMMDQMTLREKRRYGDGIPQRILFSYLQESFLIEYANIGVLPPIKRNQADTTESDASDKPRRSVYIMNVKFRDDNEDKSKKEAEHKVCEMASENNGCKKEEDEDDKNVHTYIIRVQKWDISKMLNEKKGLLESINQAENYTDYILNRRLACNLLQMKLPPSLKVRRFIEKYQGPRPEFKDLVIHNAFYERDYVPGYATNRLTEKYFKRSKNGVSFSASFVRLLGEAAAPNLIVGRSTKNQNDELIPIFDDGDEVLQLDEDNMPRRIIVTEQPGTFVYYKDPLEKQIEYYAKPIVTRYRFFQDNFDEVVNAYVDGFVKKFREIKKSAENYRNTFDDLPDKNEGSMYEKWNRVLDRLRDSNPDALASALYDAIVKQANQIRNA